MSGEQRDYHVPVRFDGKIGKRRLAIGGKSVSAVRQWFEVEIQFDFNGTGDGSRQITVEAVDMKTIAQLEGHGEPLLIRMHGQRYHVEIDRQAEIESGKERLSYFFGRNGNESIRRLVRGSGVQRSSVHVMEAKSVVSHIPLSDQAHASDSWGPEGFEGPGGDDAVNSSGSGRRSSRLSWSTCSIRWRLQPERMENLR